MARRQTSNTSQEVSPARTPRTPSVQFLQRKDFFRTFPGSSPENKNETHVKRDFISESWQQLLRKLPGPVLAEPWPTLMENGQGAKKVGPTLTVWPAKDHSKFSSRHHLSSWMWDALNKCALIQYNPASAMNHLLSHISTPQTQQQIRSVLTSMQVTLQTADDLDALYHAVMVTLSETSPTEVEARGKLTDLRPTAEETIFEYYVRFTAVASLLINAVDYNQYSTEISSAQLQMIFAETLTKADRQIDLGKLSHWLSEDTAEARKHPREAASGYENLWSLVLANERLSVPVSMSAPTKIMTAQPQAQVAMQVIGPTEGVNQLGKGRDTVTPHTKPSDSSPMANNEDLQKFIEASVAKAVKQVLQGSASDSKSPKRSRLQLDGRKTSDLADKMDQARDSDQPAWTSLPYEFKKLVIEASRTVRAAKRISSEVSTLENSMELKQHMTKINKLIDSKPDLKTRFPKGVKFCLGCVAYGHTFNMGKCPTA